MKEDKKIYAEKRGPLAKAWNFIYLAALLAIFPTAVFAAQWNVESPDGELAAQLELDDTGRLHFTLLRQDLPVIRPSPMGLRFAHTQFVSGLKQDGEKRVTLVTDQYRLWTGKKRHARYEARELRVPLRNPDGHAMQLVLRLSDDGLAYRYEFPGSSAEAWDVTEEASGIHFFENTRAWLQPKAIARSGWSNTNPSYEEDFLQDIPVGTPSPTESGWVYPALFRHGDTWLVVSETGMDGRYSATNLASDSKDGLYRLRFPQPPEVVGGGGLLPRSTLPFHTPWRLLLAGSLATLVESTLGTDLAEPSTLDNTDFIQPGISAWSWGVLKDDYTIYPVQKDFVDYAADLNWPYVLVDADWDKKIGYEKIAELANYAAEKNVGLLLWYNSSGDWNETVYSPKDRLLTRPARRAEFARLQSMGIRGVKVDFFPGDGRSVIRYYMDILEDAADHELLVNTHGSTLPRGLQRTYPNYLTSEAVKGFEFITFEQANADREPTHAAMLPFTRNLFDPMDFTPMVLGDIPDIERRTSNGFQLALPVLFTSGIQHLVSTPEQMEAVPEFAKNFLRQLPAQWDETRLLAGHPGRHVVIARRAGARWYIAGINAERESRTFELDLDFADAKNGYWIVDGKTARDLRNRPYTQGENRVSLPYGSGFVLTLTP